MEQSLHPVAIQFTRLPRQAHISHEKRITLFWCDSIISDVFNSNDVSNSLGNFCNILGQIMDWQYLINLGAGALLAIGGWFCRQLWDAVEKLKNDIGRLELHMSENYVKKSEIEGFRADMDKRFDRIEVLLDKLYEKLDSKVDK